jgi:hypothetical protein
VRRTSLRLRMIDVSLDAVMNRHAQPIPLHRPPGGGAGDRRGPVSAGGLAGAQADGKLRRRNRRDAATARGANGEEANSFRRSMEICGV